MLKLSTTQHPQTDAAEALHALNVPMPLNAEALNVLTVSERLRAEGSTCVSDRPQEGLTKNADLSAASGGGSGLKAQPAFLIGQRLNKAQRGQKLKTGFSQRPQ